MSRKALSLVCLTAASAAVIAGASCGEKKAFNAVIDFFTGTVTVVREKMTEPAAVRKQLFKGDMIRTAADSHAFVQLGETHMIHMSGNTECAISSLAGMISAAVSGTDVHLERGSLGVKAGKLMKGSSFRISTPTIVVAVRGTLFRVLQKGDHSRVIVNKGKVAIKSRTGAFPEIILDAGKEAIISGSSVSTRASDRDSGYFRKLQGIGDIKDINKLDDAELVKIFSGITGKKVPEQSDNDTDNKSNVLSPREKGGDVVKKTEPKAVAVKARMAVTVLSANGVDASEAAGISEKIYANLAAMKGGTVVVFRKKYDKRSANRILTGRVSRLGKSTIISVSVVDGEKGAVLFNKTVTVKGDQNIDDSIKAISGQIAGMDTLWE